MGDPWKSISPEGVRAFTYGVLSTLLIWLWAEDYLLIVNDLQITVGTSILLAMRMEQGARLPRFKAVRFAEKTFPVHAGSGSYRFQFMPVHGPLLKNQQNQTKINDFSCNCSSKFYFVGSDVLQATIFG